MSIVGSVRDGLPSAAERICVEMADGPLTNKPHIARSLKRVRSERRSLTLCVLLFGVMLVAVMAAAAFNGNFGPVIAGVGFVVTHIPVCIWIYRMHGQQIARLESMLAEEPP